MKVDVIQTIRPKNPVATPNFESYDEDMQSCIVRLAAHRNMAPQEYVEYLNDPNRTPLTIKEFLAGFDNTSTSYFTQAELLEILDEVRGGR